MSRRELREHMLRMLYQQEFHQTNTRAEQLELYFDNLDMTVEDEDKKVKEPTQEEKDYLTGRLEKIMECLPEIDEAISQVSEGWTLSRMGCIERTVLRLAFYEMNYDEEVPVGVAINEAVELAKKYGQENSSGFVNGILAKLAHES
ncbi:MAG: transcription antitermination factor NusB [Clostridiales bacterium]|nr:transcription antitermination factor NusB [Clostridiales bacterium]